MRTFAPFIPLMIPFVAALVLTFLTGCTPAESYDARSNAELIREIDAGRCPENYQCFWDEPTGESTYTLYARAEQD
jgi:hypothetical protein